ncbi:PREDICTED: retrotransposon, partial [Prunus dulcis]
HMRSSSSRHQGEMAIEETWLLLVAILKDCIEYAKGCQDCQRHGLVHHVPVGRMNPIMKAWPYKGWAMDVIGQIHPKLSKCQ